MADSQRVPHAEWVQAMSLAGTVEQRVGMLLFIETHWRIHGNEFGAVPRPLRDDAYTQGGYCIDAKETLPAGACTWCQVDAIDETYGFPEQVLIERGGRVNG